MVRFSVVYDSFKKRHDDLTPFGLISSLRFWYYDGRKFKPVSFFGRSYCPSIDCYLYTFNIPNEHGSLFSLTFSELMSFPLYVLPRASVAAEFYSYHSINPKVKNFDK